MKIPFYDKLNDIENSGCIGGILGGTMGTILFVPSVMPLLPYVAIGSTAMAIGAFIGTNGAGAHSNYNIEAFVKGAVETISFGYSLSLLSKKVKGKKDKDDWLDIHGPVPVRCDKCGTWLPRHGEPHICLPQLG